MSVIWIISVSIFTPIFLVKLGSVNVQMCLCIKGKTSHLILGSSLREDVASLCDWFPIPVPAFHYLYVMFVYFPPVLWCFQFADDQFVHYVPVVPNVLWRIRCPVFADVAGLNTCKTFTFTIKVVYVMVNWTCSLKWHQPTLKCVTIRCNTM